MKARIKRHYRQQLSLNVKDPRGVNWSRVFPKRNIVQVSSGKLATARKELFPFEAENLFLMRDGSYVPITGSEQIGQGTFTFGFTGNRAIFPAGIPGPRPIYDTHGAAKYTRFRRK